MIRRSREAGFVITLEFLLVTVLFVMPVLIGGFLLARKAVTLYLNNRETVDQYYSRAVVWDSASPARIIGPVVGYDAFESPLVLFRDEASKLGVVLGVRGSRFTSYGQVFYSDDACTADPYVRAYDATTATPLVLALPTYPPVGHAYQMQGRSFAMGNANILYDSPDDTSSSISIVSTGINLFVWMSQDVAAPTVAPSPPCYVVPAGTTVTGLVVANAIVDFDAGGNYVPPFRLAFPTATAGPPLPVGE